MMRHWLPCLLTLPLAAQVGGGAVHPHGWAMSLGTGFDKAPILLDVRYTFSPGIGFYLGGGGTPDTKRDSWNFDWNLNQRGTLKKTQHAAYVGVAVTQLPKVAWGLGYGRHTTEWEVDQGGWFTAEEMAQLDTSYVKQGAHGWIALYWNRMFGVQVQAGPGWGGVSLTLRFY